MTTDRSQILSEAHDALETFRGYLAGISDESRRESVRSRIFEPLSRAVALLHLDQHLADTLADTIAKRNETSIFGSIDPEEIIEEARGASPQEKQT